VIEDKNILNNSSRKNMIPLKKYLEEKKEIKKIDAPWSIGGYL